MAHINTNPAAVTDISLMANVTYTAGSDHESGTAKLDALGISTVTVKHNDQGKIAE